MYKEDSFLSSGVDLIASDCPLIMICAYVRRNKLPFYDELISLSKKFDEVYPSINLFLNRADIPYKIEGRYETYEQALQMDNLIEEILEENCVYQKVKTKERHEILSNIISQLEQS